MRVRGMMNDYSQHRVLVTVLFIPDRETGGGAGRRLFYEPDAVKILNTSLQSPELRQ